MRTLLTILGCLILTGAPLPGKAQPAFSRQQIDQMLDSAVYGIERYNYQANIPATQALNAATRQNYTHGVALALACQAAYTEYALNDFPKAEHLASASLNAFSNTPDKHHLFLAWHTLAFAVFAQSRFQESIRYLECAQQAAAQEHDTVNMIKNYTLIGCAYRESGDYERSFAVLSRCYNMSAETHHPDLQATQNKELASLYLDIEDFPAAEKCLQAAGIHFSREKNHTWATMLYAGLLTREHRFDSAQYFYDHFDSAGASTADQRTFQVSKGEFLAELGQYAQALPYFTKSLALQRRLNDRNQLMRCLKDLATTSRELGNDKEAFSYAREGLGIATQYQARQYIRDNCRILHELYDKSGRSDSAYAYYKRYMTMKDSVNNQQLKGKFAAYASQQQIALLTKEQQLQSVCIREQMLTKRLLIGSIVAILLIGFIFSRYILLKRKNEAHLRQRAENQLEIQQLESDKARSALQQKAKELEVQALRAQMNPHFIFNCLNAINRFVLSHETQTAADYLTKFSRLMRMTMNHSRYPQITLAEELEMLELYLVMEKLRFKNAFDHSVSIRRDIDPADIYIPPLLMQPFVENAVWHGLMHKKERGYVSICISAEDNILTCIISDNGIGRKKAAQLKSKSAEKYKSMGLQITAERLSLLAGKNGPEHFFSIEDLYDETGHPTGTRVTLTIKIDVIHYTV